jgi:hypothetical protein
MLPTKHGIDLSLQVGSICHIQQFLQHKTMQTEAVQ